MSKFFDGKMANPSSNGNEFILLKKKSLQLNSMVPSEEENEEDGCSDDESEEYYGTRKIVFGFLDERSFVFWANEHFPDYDVSIKRVFYHDDENFNNMRNGIFIESGPSKNLRIVAAPKTRDDGSFTFHKKKNEISTEKTKVVVNIICLSSRKSEILYQVKMCVFECDPQNPHFFCSMECDEDLKLKFPNNSFPYRSTIIEYLYRFQKEVFLGIKELSVNLEKEVDNFFIEDFIDKGCSKAIDCFKKKAEMKTTDCDYPKEFLQDEDITLEEQNQIYENVEKEVGINLELEESEIGYD